MLKKVFDFLIFSSLFIALCAVLMVYQVQILFDVPVSFNLLGFVFCGSVCSYNFHWYLTPPGTDNPSGKLAWNLSNKPLHLVLFLAGLAGSALFSLLLIDHWFWLGITAFFTFLYSAPMIGHPLFGHLKKIALGKTIFLAFAWTHVTTLLPMVIHHTSLSWQHEVFVVNRFFFLYAICILFDYRDVKTDKENGIRSMITYLDSKGVDILFWGSVMVYVLTSFLIFSVQPAALAAILVPGIILSLLYYQGKKNPSDYLYYFVLDGLMMLSAPLLLLAKFVR